MPKEKRSWKHIHKIKVHDNRWLAWTIAIAVLVCAALVAYIQVSDIHFETQMRFSSGPTGNWTSFNHRTAGYSLKYPKTWGLEAESDTGMAFVNSQDPNEYFSVTTYPVSQEKIIRASLFATKEESTKVAGLPATMISQSKDQPESVVMVKEGQTLFVLRGRGENFERILATFRLNQKLE